MTKAREIKTEGLLHESYDWLFASNQPLCGAEHQRAARKGRIG